MIQQIRFLKDESGWVNFPECAIKLGFVKGNEVLNVSSCQTEGLKGWDSYLPGRKGSQLRFRNYATSQQAEEHN